MLENAAVSCPDIPTNNSYCYQSVYAVILVRSTTRYYRLRTGFLASFLRPHETSARGRCMNPRVKKMPTVQLSYISLNHLP